MLFHHSSTRTSHEKTLVGFPSEEAALDLGLARTFLVQAKEYPADIKRLVFSEGRGLMARAMLALAAGASEQPVLWMYQESAPCPLGLRTLFFGKFWRRKALRKIFSYQPL